MGCYNGEGCISGLPIQYDDLVGALTCVSTKDYAGNEMITPVWPIIWGKYNDYGGIIAESEDFELIQYFGNRKDLLHDLERVTHNCRHQVKEGLPENICLIIEHRDVLKTLIAFGDPNTIKVNYHSGNRYRIDYKPSNLFADDNNIYRRHNSFYDNRVFLKFFRECFQKDIPANRLQSYFESVALYESMIENSIFLKWQRFAGWQWPSRQSDVWKQLCEVYNKLTV